MACRLQCHLWSFFFSPCSPEHGASSQPGTRCCSGWVHHKGAGTCLYVCVCVYVRQNHSVPVQITWEVLTEAEVVKMILFFWMSGRGQMIQIVAQLLDIIFLHNCKKKRAKSKSSSGVWCRWIAHNPPCMVSASGSFSVEPSPAFWVCRGCFFIIGCKESDVTLPPYWKVAWVMRLGDQPLPRCILFQ